MRLCRALDAAEALDATCWADQCTAPPAFRIATPHGLWDACDTHSDELLAALPNDWVTAWAPQPPFPFPDVDEDDIPF